MGTVGAMKPKLRRVPTGARSPAVEELALAHALEECLEAMAQGETDLDRLVLRVWTDGSIDPRTALDHAVETLRTQLNVFSLESTELEPDQVPVMTIPTKAPDAADEIRSLLSIAKELQDKGAPGSVLALEFKETLRDRLRQRLNA